MKHLTPKSSIGFTAQYLTVDGQPWFPVMGEIHYSRVPADRWEAELLKMKAGGVDLVSCYSIWIHHEEVKGEPDFSGGKDLRAFLELVAGCGLHCLLRIGPWIHGEVRNGGFPDWMVELEKSGAFRLRSNDPGYLLEVDRWYRMVYEQVQGLLLRDGGPVIGVQIENEFGHCGGLTGDEGEMHMATLLRAAQQIGYHVPIYTATGWGGAVTGGMLPVMGGYCEAPWDQRITEIEPSANYVFTAERNDHGIGSDYGLGEGITFDMNRFPYLTAELGGGLQVTGHRRPIASADDIAAMSMVKLGSGCNLLGYYMYHGGTNPEGRLTTLQESRETGYPNDLPVLSYDFNAPLREYGQITDTFRRIRMLAYFVHDYEDVLCRTKYIPQPGNAADADDLTSLRTAVRCGKPVGIPENAKAEQAGESAGAAGSESENAPAGFFFVNNYQRRFRMADHPASPLRAYGQTAAGSTRILADFGTRDIRDGEYFFYPFNLRLSPRVLLRSVNAVPLCILHGSPEERALEQQNACVQKASGRNTYVFYAKGMQKEEVHYDLKAADDLIGRGSSADCAAAGLKIITLAEEEALHASRIVIDGREHLLISEADAVTEKDGKISLLLRVEQSGGARLRFKVYPDLDTCPAGFEKVSAGRAETESKKALYAGNETFAEYQSVKEFNVPVQVRWGEIMDGPCGRENCVPEESVEPKTCRKAFYSIHAEVDAEQTESEDSGQSRHVSLTSALVRIEYAGNKAELYRAENGGEESVSNPLVKDGMKLVADNYYTGQDWELDLSNFVKAGRQDVHSKLTFDGQIEIEPLTQDTPVYLQKWPRLVKGRACRIERIRTACVWQVPLRM